MELPSAERNEKKDRKNPFLCDVAKDNNDDDKNDNDDEER